MNVRKLGWLTVSAMALLLTFGCGDDETNTSGAGGSVATGGAGGAGGAGGQALPFGSAADIQMAADLWTEMDGYDMWPALSTPGFVMGAMPHASVQKRFVNTIGEADLTADGTIIVKANYMMEDESTLAALTVMKKVDGFNPDEADWFWANFAPDGTLNQNGDGVSLAGKIGKGGTMGCIPCHAGAAGGDFVFDND